MPDDKSQCDELYVNIQLMPDKNGKVWQEVRGDVRQAVPKFLALLNFMGYDVEKMCEYVTKKREKGYKGYNPFGV